MKVKDNTARIIGLLIIVQLIVGILTNFILIGPIFANGGFIINAAANAQQLGISAIIAVTSNSLSIAIAAMIYPLVKSRSEPLAICYIALCCTLLATGIMEQVGMLSLTSFSEAYVTADKSVQEILVHSKFIVTALRNWAHYLGMFLSGASIMVFYTLMLRSELIPKALTIFGLCAASLQLIAISMPILGYQMVFAMIAPLAISQILLAAWLLIKGFNTKP